MSTESPFPNSDPLGAHHAEDSHATSAYEESFSDDDGVLYDDEVTPEYGILGFTLRELLIVGVWLVLFVISFFPVYGDASLWGTGIQWVLPIGLPTAAVFLIVLRRFSPDGIRRVGSLGIDQFASVAFSVSATVWIGSLWLAVTTLIDAGIWTLPWNAVILLIASLALVVLTVFAPLIPGLKEDFQGRLVTLAHRNANPVRPVIARPRPDSAPDADGSASATHEGAHAPTPTAVGPAPHDEASYVAAYGAADHYSDSASDTSTRAVSTAGLDHDFSDRYATDEVARVGLAEQVPLAAHASGGGTGTEQTLADQDYAPAYSRSSRGQEPEIVSDTGSIESLLQTSARVESGQGAAPLGGVREDDDVDVTNPRETAPAAQPFWVLAPTERDVHDEHGQAIFRIGPHAWTLVIEDRGGAYVVRHDDGRIGYLHDIADLAKG